MVTESSGRSLQRDLRGFWPILLLEVALSYLTYRYLTRRALGMPLAAVLDVPDFRDCLIDWELFTPFDMEQRLGLTNGNIRHLDIVPSQFLGNRPIPGWAHYRTPVGGLYLSGAGVHPGGEVTGAPGHNAAQAILADG